ncbi:MAG: NAD(P)H-binding protein [Actinobacteria bacterium]|nr:NAD(P)H-binding protein [Actinomycetota bacterium]
MPVLVTGAETAAAPPVVRELLRAGGEVRAYLPPAAPADELRGAGCKVAVGDIEDEGRLELALQQVHTVVHVGEGPLDDPTGALDALAGVVSAAIGAGCRRLVWTSHLGAERPGASAYLRACAEAEALLAEAPLETVVIRCALRFGAGDPLTRLLASGGALTGPGVAAARHAPLFAEDLARAVAAIDRARSETGGGQRVLRLQGPRALRLDRFAALLGAPGGLRGAGARLRARTGRPALPAGAAEVLARDTVADAGCTLRAWGLSPTPLEEAARRVREA